MRSLTILAVSAAFAVAGCGGDEKDTETTASAPAAQAAGDRGYEGDGPEAVVQAYVDAFGAGDYAAACELVDAKAMEKLTETGKFECVEVFERGGLQIDATEDQFKGATVTDAQITGDRGSVGVKIKNGSELRLQVVIEDGKWKVAN